MKDSCTELQHLPILTQVSRPPVTSTVKRYFHLKEFVPLHNERLPKYSARRHSADLTTILYLQTKPPMQHARLTRSPQMHQHGKPEPHRNRSPETGNPHPQGTETMQCPTRLQSAALPQHSLPFLEHSVIPAVWQRSASHCFSALAVQHCRGSSWPAASLVCHTTNTGQCVQYLLLCVFADRAAQGGPGLPLDVTLCCKTTLE